MNNVSFLDNDLYKFTMGQFIWHMSLINKLPPIQVKYEFKCRDNVDFSWLDFDKLIRDINIYKNKKITNEEYIYLSTLQTKSFYFPKPYKIFDSAYLEFINDKISEKFENVIFKIKTNLNTYNKIGLSLSIEGPWEEAIFFEVPILNMISEQYTEYITSRLSPIYQNMFNEIGDKNLDFKIRKICANRSLRFSDFGTRRRSSFKNQCKVLKKLTNLGDDGYHLSGTSNMLLAKQLNIPCIGTFAHELPMVLASIFNDDLEKTYKFIMEEWTQYYKGYLSIFLTDTFTTDHLFKISGKKLVNSFEGVRQDSGDPFEFGCKYIKLCKENNINPRNRVIVFSDNLTLDLMENLLDYFKDQVWVTFGWGTNLTNDCGFKPLNNVIKVSECYTEGKYYNPVKLSDDLGKHTGINHRLDMYMEKVK